MGPVNWAATGLATLAFWAVTLGWARATRRRTGAGSAALSLLFAFLICSTIGHLFARIGTPAPRAILMIAGGFAVTVIAPALAIVALQQGRALRGVLGDAAQLLAALIAAGVIFIVVR